jgi:hypothetical protein
MRSRRPSPPPPRRREPHRLLLSRAAIIADRRRIPPPRRRRQCRPPPITPPPIWAGRHQEAHRRRRSPPAPTAVGRHMAAALRRRAEPTRPTDSSRPAPTPDIRRREGRRESADRPLDILAIRAGRRLRPPVRDIPEDRPRSAAILLVGLLVIPADRYRRPPAVLLLPGTQQAERPSPGDLLRPLPDIRLRAEHLPPKLCCIMYIVVKYRTVSCRYSFYRRS